MAIKSWHDFTISTTISTNFTMAILLLPWPFFRIFSGMLYNNICGCRVRNISSIAFQLQSSAHTVGSPTECFSLQHPRSFQLFRLLARFCLSRRPQELRSLLRICFACETVQQPRPIASSATRKAYHAYEVVFLSCSSIHTSQRATKVSHPR